MTWTVETLGAIVDAEIAALPKDMQASFLRLSERIEAVGLERIGQPHVKHLRGKLWEMRFGGREGIARAIYLTAIGRRVIVVHAFVKKTQKTPRSALELAERRAEEIKP
ncbi:MAG: type II toxin-antitoxin system RelE/ParE family toxin [Caulobacteraceae bacterium]